MNAELEVARWWNDKDESADEVFADVTKDDESDSGMQPYFQNMFNLWINILYEFTNMAIY